MPSWWTGEDYLEGTGVALIVAGEGPGSFSENRYRFAAFGSPGADTDDLHGAVRLVEADVLSGELNYASTKNTMVSGYGLGAYQFGHEVLAMDIRECHRSGMVALEDRGCGQELLVAAPDFSGVDGGGTVFWYPFQKDLYGTVTYGGSVSTPHPTSIIGGFGMAMAAWAPPPDPTVPYQVSPSHPSWLAISAPFDEAVYIYEVDPTATNPLSLVQTLIPPTGLGANLNNKAFGWSLAAEDFDEDGFADLAVGLPQSNATSGGTTGGAVVVYPGAASGASPLDTANASLVTASTYPVNNELGYALAAGGLFGGAPGLLIGSPGFEVTGVTDVGQVCTAQLSRVTGSPFTAVVNCVQSPNFQLSVIDGYHGARFGETVAMGDFVHADGAGAEASDEARLLEVAVGLPDYDGGAGMVEVYLPGLTEPDFTVLSHQLKDTSGTTGAAVARYGTSLATGYIQETGWQDLIIGEPEWYDPISAYTVGKSVVTRAQPIGGDCAAVGQWDFVDAAGNTVNIKVYVDEIDDGGLHILFEDDAAISLTDASGQDCSFYVEQDTGWPGGCLPPSIYLPASTEIDLRNEDLSSGTAGDYCNTGCRTLNWTAEGGDTLEAVLTSLGIWDDLADPADTGEYTGFQDDVRALELHYEFRFEEAGTACNSGTEDRIGFDLSLSWQASSALVIGDLLNAGRYGQVFGCFDASCQFTPALSADYFSEVVCE